MTEKRIGLYHEFIDTTYKPKHDNLRALFYYNSANGVSREAAIGRIVFESSSRT